MEIEKSPLIEKEAIVSKSQQVFIVDDDESVCRALSVLLVTYGFVVSTFNSAEDFFCAVPNNVPGCVVLDIHMPGLDGWKMLRHLLPSECDRPIIIISAEKNGGLKERALKAGAIGFLQKPFDGQKLVDLISKSFK
jgi:FixJ family two-component response regulator